MKRVTVQVFDRATLLDHPTRVEPDPRAVAQAARRSYVARMQDSWKGEPVPAPTVPAAVLDAGCGCESCSGNRRTAAQDRLSRATPGERAIAAALADSSRSTPGRDAYQARMELAYLRRPQAL